MPTLEQALHTYLQLDRRPMTNYQYRLVLGKFVTAIGPGRDVRLATYEDLIDYLARLRERGLRPFTVANHTAVIKAFFHWCVERRYIDTSPAEGIARSIPRRDPSQSRAIPPDELQRMIQYAKATSPRNYAILLFFADTGCRVGGLVSLTLANLDLEHHVALLEEKGGQPHRARFGVQTAAALENWLRVRPKVAHDYVFTTSGSGRPLKRQSVASMVTKLARRTDASEDWSPHSIRHAVGHAYAKAGVPVTITQRKLGHSHPSVTAAFYYPTDDAYLDLVSQRLELAALKSEDELQAPSAQVSSIEKKRTS